MKKSKRALYVLLCLALALGLAAPALAAGTEPEIVWLEENVIPLDMVEEKAYYGYPSEEVQAGDPIPVVRLNEDGSRSFGCVDAKGKYVVPFTEYASNSDISPRFFYSEGLLPVVTWASTGVPEKCEYVDKKGKTVLKLEEGLLGRPFVEGRAAVCKFDEFGNAKWGFIDRDGKALTLYKYDAVEPFSGGVARVKEGGSWGYIDLEGKSVSAPEGGEEALLEQVERTLYWDYDYKSFDYEIVSVSEGMVKFRMYERDSEGRKLSIYKLFNTEDNSLLEPPYDWMGDFFEGLARVGNYTYDSEGNQESSSYGFIDKTGALVIPMEYGEGTYDIISGRVGKFVGGVALVTKYTAEEGVRCGWINTAGETVIPFDYTDAGDFSEGLAAVEQDGKWGFINTAGETVIPCEYTAAGGFSGGLATVSKDGKTGFINQKGETVIPCEYVWTDFPMLDGYIGTVRRNGAAGYCYGIFVNPCSPQAQAAANPLGGLLGVVGGDPSAPGDPASGGFPVIPVAGGVAAVAAAVAVGAFLMSRRKKR